MRLWFELMKFCSFLRGVTWIRVENMQVGKVKYEEFCLDDSENSFMFHLFDFFRFSSSSFSALGMKCIIYPPPKLLHHSIKKANRVIMFLCCLMVARSKRQLQNAPLLLSYSRRLSCHTFVPPSRLTLTEYVPSVW